MAKLGEDVKAFIVRELACFTTPTEVTELVRQKYGVDVTRQRVECYHPYRLAGVALSLKWQRLFASAREEFERQAGQIGISHKVVRLRQLDDMCRLAEAAGNYQLAAKILAIAAAELP